MRELCLAIRALRPDLLLAVDQEGGRVQRLRNGFVRLPSMQALAAAPDAAALAGHCGWLMATEVLAVGLDFSFAPVLDLDHGRSTVIGSRSFGSEPARVSRTGRGLHRRPARGGHGRHRQAFPRHGWPEADSHVAVPRDERSLEAIRACDLQPFAQRLGGSTASCRPM